MFLSVVSSHANALSSQVLHQGVVVCFLIMVGPPPAFELPENSAELSESQLVFCSL